LSSDESKSVSAKFLEEIAKEKKEEGLRLKELKESNRTIFRSAIIGTGIGSIPGIGQVVSSFLCYGIAKSNSRKPEMFGKGSLEGVAAAEAGNNAVNGSSLMPLLVLGIPGDIVTAVLFSAFMVHGLRPGPRLFQTEGAIIYSILWALLLSNGVLLILGKLALRYVALIARFPGHIVFPSIVSLCFVGSYSVNNSVFDVFLVLVFGAIGYVMHKFKIPIAPLLITFILGPLFESALGQSLIMSDGSFLIFIIRPISLLFVILTPVALIFLLRHLPKVE
jgi:putative tricarboxylic transport membrane protein